MAGYTLQSFNTETNKLVKKNLSASGKSWLKAQHGTQYQVVDQLTGQTPKKQLLRKKGKNLIVEVDGQPVVTLQDFYAHAEGQRDPIYRVTGSCGADDTQALDKAKNSEIAEDIVGGASSGSSAPAGDGVVWQADAARCAIEKPSDLAGLDAAQAGADASQGLSETQLIGLGLGALLVGGGATAIASGGGGGGSSSQPTATAPTQPAAPQLTSVADDVPGMVGNLQSGATTNDSQPTLLFTAAAGSMVKVYDGGAFLGNAVEGPAGTFTFTPTAPLADGPHSLTATATNANGTSAPTAAFELVVDTIIPLNADGALTAVAGNDTGALGDNITGDNTPEISGVTVPGSTVSVVVNGQTYQTTADATTGAWSIVTATLPDGQYTPVITVTDPSNRTVTADGTPLTIDTTAPLTPVVIALTANTLTPTITGTAIVGAGETLNVTVSGATYTVTPDSNGVWSLNLATAIPSSGALQPLVDGQSYSVAAVVTDLAGNTSTDSTSSELTINLGAPSVTISESPFGVSAAEAASVGGTPVVTALPSSAHAGDVVNTVVTKPGGATFTLSTVLSQADVDAGTISQIIPTSDLTVDGPWTTSTTITDPVTQVTGPAAPGGFVLDTAAPATPTTNLPESSNGINATEAASAGGTPLVTTLPSGLVAGDVVTSVVTKPDGTTLTLSTVITAADINAGTISQIIPTAELDQQGYWSTSTTIADQAGNTSAPAPGSFTLDTAAPGISLTRVVDDVAGITGQLLNNALTNDNKPTLTFAAAPGSTVEVFDGTNSLGVATEGPAGVFTLTPATALSDGAHSFTAKATDAAGNTSAPTTPFVLNIDADAPDPFTTSIPEGALVNAAEKSSVGGTPVEIPLPADAQAGDVVKTIVTKPDGTTMTLTTVLTAADITAGTISQVISTAALSQEGAWSTSTTITDAAGNSTTAPTVGFTLDTTASLSLTSVVDDVAGLTGALSSTNLTNDKRPTLTYAADPGSTVTIYDNGVSIGTAVANGSGVATFIPTSDLTDGSHSFTASSVDPAGNAAAITTPFVLEIDGTPPSAPSLATPEGPLVDLTEKADGTPIVITLPADAKVGDIVTTTVTKPGGATLTYTHTLVAGDLPVSQGGTLADGGTYTITETIPAADLNADGAWSVSSKVTDVAGNSSSAGTSGFTLSTTGVAISSAQVVSTTIGSGSVTDTCETITGTSSQYFNLSSAGSNADVSMGAGFGSGSCMKFNLANNTSAQTGDIVLTTKNGLNLTSMTFQYYDLLTAKTISFYNGSTQVYSTTLAANAGTPNTNFSTGTLSTFNKVVISGGDLDYFNIDTIVMNASNVTTTVTNTVNTNSSVVSTTPTLSGTLTHALNAGETVHVFKDGVDVGTATVSGTAWTYNASIATGSTNNFVAKVLTSSNELVSSSSSFTITQSATGTTPLALDLNGDGVQTIAAEQGVSFDLDNTGTAYQVGWIDSNDALLAIDLNRDGQINDGSELFGSGTMLADGSKAQTGWQALAQYDLNQDLLIDQHDAIFASLQVWQDANSDGRTDAGELKTLAELGIVSISLDHNDQAVQQNGNTLQHFSSYQTADGQAHEVVDAWFAVQQIVEMQQQIQNATPIIHG